MPNWYKIQNIYVWSQKVRPSHVSYDFTTQDVLTFVSQQNQYSTYWWVSWSWYYCRWTYSSYYNNNVVWKMPVEAYKWWVINLVKLEMNVYNNYSGWGIVISDSYPAVRYWYWLGCWDSSSNNQMTTPWASYSSYPYTSWIQTLIIDLVNNQMYMEWNASTPISLSASQVTEIRTARTNKTFYLNCVCNQGIPNNYTYLRKVQIFAE